MQKLLLKCLCMAFALSLSPRLGYAQTFLAGHVFDQEKEVVISATITVREPNGKILAFSITDANGYFKTEIQNPDDSLLLQVSHLNYDTYTALLSSHGEYSSIQLFERTFDLPSLTVKQAPVIRKGDTLVYDVNQLRQAGDETVEQLLSNIPGIEINLDGTIKYQGLPINKFYIEGLDLLEGRYALATRNISPDAVRDVEVLQSHQPIRALDSIVRPPNAAINLKLKSGLLITGQLEGAAGSSRQRSRYGADGILFGFTPKRQFNVVGSVNNLGSNLTEQFKDHYGNEEESLVPAISPTIPIVPIDLKPTAYLENEEATIGGNLLRKVGSAGQFKWNSSIFTDNQQHYATRLATPRGIFADVTQNQQSRAISTPRLFESKATYVLNKSTMYIKSVFNGTYKLTENETVGTFNALRFDEFFAGKDYQYVGKFDAIFRKGLKARRYSGSYSTQQIRSNLAVTPTLISLMGTEVEVAQAAQSVVQQIVRADVNTIRYARIGNWSGRLTAGLRWQRRRLSSELELDSPISFNGPLTNQNSRSVVSPYLQQVYSKKSKAGEWSLAFPVALHALRTIGRPSDDASVSYLPVLSPKIKYTHRLNPFITLETYLTHRRGYADESAVYNGFILTQNRNLERRLLSVNRTAEYEGDVSFRGNNMYNTINYRIKGTGAINKSLFLPSVVISNQSEVVAIVEQPNVQRRFTIIGSLQGEVSSILSLGINLSGSSFVTEASIEGRTQFINRSEFKSQLHTTLAFNQSALNINPTYTRFGGDNNESHRWQLDASYYLEVGKTQGALRFNTKSFITNTELKSVANHYVSLSYQQPILKKKYTFEARVDNLTNSQDFTSFFQNTYFNQNLTYQLRSRQLVLVLRRQL